MIYPRVGNWTGASFFSKAVTFNRRVLQMKIPAYMNAAVLTGPGKLEIQKVPVPELGNSDVLIQVKACAVCASDVSLIQKPWPGQPDFGAFIPGHEYAGIVAAVGETVTEVNVGDHVSVEAHYGCGRCDNCRKGFYTACLNWGDHLKGHRANGLTSNGGFAEYVVNHVSTVFRLPAEISFEEAALLTNLGCVLYGFELFGGYIVGDRVAVIGEGPLGLLSVQVAKNLGADEVFLLGIDPHRLELGKKMGADTILNVNDEDPLQTLKPDYHMGVDLAIEASGSPDGLKMAALLPKWTGKVLVLGIPKNDVAIDFHDFVRANKFMYTVRGEGWSNCKRGISLLKQGRIDLKSLVSHTFSLDSINEAFATHVEKRGNALKVIVKTEPGPLGYKA